MQNNFNCIAIIGTTASGKTKLACNLAFHLNGEIISADSRQVYKHLTIGTGKDLEEYHINSRKINYHFIDICEPEEQFFLHQFCEGLKISFESITQRHKLPIICGGTGLYIDALHKDFSFTQIKENEELRKSLEQKTKEELLIQLSTFPKEIIHHVDINSKKRIIRGIEIAEYFSKNNIQLQKTELPYNPLYIGIKTNVEERKPLISKRLLHRLDNGLIEEVEELLQKGITHERLQFLGLEYKFISLYLLGNITKQKLIEQLQTAIFQFAKRQQTWFNKLEKEGITVNWIEKDYKLQEVIQFISEKMERV
ncbi:MAG: tRNA (adenosine(37)-N6)-dimethylallyltransferase MiaA [Bacteroidota bacterium]|nr:tRNA (adenosine(37)-N6)-dimethylallyltransferase MiaA [Bacteroidota bacterium]